MTKTNPLEERMQRNQAVYDEPVRDFHNLFLFPAEVLVLDRFREELGDFSVLDLGVGAGRTAWTFGTMAGRYEAIDYAPGRIAHCEELFPPSPHRRFSVGDARDLSRYHDGEFDFVLFSYNGLDYIDPAGREMALAEMRRVLKPGGWLFFSTHSLDAFPFRPPMPKRLRGALAPLGQIYRLAIAAKMRWLNRHVDPDKAKREGIACLIDYATTVTTCYVDPRRQCETLESLGFEIEDMWDTRGRPYSGEEAPDEWMIHYLARKSGIGGSSNPGSVPKFDSAPALSR